MTLSDKFLLVIYKLIAPLNIKWSTLYKIIVTLNIKYILNSNPFRNSECLSNSGFFLIYLVWMVITLHSGGILVLLLSAMDLMSVRKRSKSSTGRWQYMYRRRYFGSKNFNGVWSVTLHWNSLSFYQMTKTIIISSYLYTLLLHIHRRLNSYFKNWEIY
jgi:hypothetical protein